jgi:hypothetical protein
MKKLAGNGVPTSAAAAEHPRALEPGNAGAWPG